MIHASKHRRSTRSSKMVSWSGITRIQQILQKKLVREFLAEFMSTYVMMVFGLGSVAHMVLSKKHGSYLAVNLAFGFGVTMGVHMAGNISGAHMNAAVTFANCALGRLPWRKFPVYVLGQCLGSFLAAATIHTLFYTAILHFSGGQLMVTGPVATAGIFATYLPDYMTLWRGFLNEENNPALPGTQALVIGILVVTIGMSLGMNTGYAINPSRDLPPRIFTFIAGWGKQVFSDGENWWWVPVVAPPLGAYLGGIIYVVFIGSTIPREPPKLEDPVTYEDHRITVSTKMEPHASVASPLTPVSVSPDNRPSVRLAPTLQESMAQEHF
ncbi:aquaporin-7 isoform X3 [Callithrix jacchus]|uniref:aquaporin-7 isoform X2 n=1 Tax=Callithrix jacchus TaxID=9483 RepID=UPI0004F0A4E1|nr:aquaporin-7 isoform X2 [Callithrix jacchus]